MTSIPLFSLTFHPSEIRRAAEGRSGLVAMALNALNGILILSALALQCRPLFTAPLVAVLCILFGPLAGLLISRLYSGLEWTVGRRLKGAGSRDLLHGILTWSFLPLGFAVLLESAILLILRGYTIATLIAASLPSLFIAFLCVRSYCSNVIAVHHVTRKRGAAGILVTLLLFLLVIIGAACLVALAVKYGTGDYLKMILLLS
jgi:hypothetical protein